MSTETRLIPDTATLHLEFNADEDVDVELIVRDKEGTPVPLISAVGTIAIPGCDVLHQWSADAGNLTLLDQESQPGGLILASTRTETAAWYAAWADAEWQLDVVDLFNRQKRACEGDVRVNPTRRGGAS